MDTDKLEQYEHSWGIHQDNPHKFSNVKDLHELCKANVKIENTSFDAVKNAFDAYTETLIDFINESKKLGLEPEHEIRINRLLEILYYTEHMCTSSARVFEALDLSKDYRDNTDASLFRFRAVDKDDNNKYQNFLLYILGVFYKNKYARYLGDVYQEIYYNGHNTCAWKRVDTITNVIYKCITKEINYDQFINVTHNGNTVRLATEFLTNCYDSQFPALEKNRHAFSFRNGIYIAKHIENDQVTDKFIEYSQNTDKITAAKYFDYDFVYKRKWQDIDTPHFDSIFKAQNIPDDVMEWVYAFTGRLLYEIDDLDGWQVIFFILGQAGTGKSTYVLNVCKQIYEEEDVGIMSNNIQRTFGLSDLVDKLLYVAPEIKRDFSIEQGEFQSIVSGDKITINIKYKQSRFENWSIPGVFAGNESPDFIDNSGSIQRRIVSVKFKQKVRDGDLMLGKKLRREMPNILQKCNKAYQEKALMHGRSNIWTILPDYFKQMQNELAQATNPLLHFLASGKVTLGPEKFIPEKLFVTLFNQHCLENNYSRHRFNPDFYVGPFSQTGIYVDSKTKRKYDGKTSGGTFFIGVDISDDNDEPDDKF